jgi:3-oxoacyl-[acyl-carrier protein] reductase
MRNVIVTGGSRGLGLAMGVRLVKSGYRVIAIARKQSEALTQAMAESNDALCFYAADLGEIGALPELVRGLRQEFGAIYGLVNNAGMGTEGLLAMMHNSQIEALIRLNTLSPIVLTKYVVRQMMAEGCGRIINVASIIASTGYNGLSVYGATKASLVGFTRSLAREVGEIGITVNAVAPGFVATEMTSGLDEGQRDKIAGRSALRRLAEPDDVAGAVDYLMSEIARNVTGTVMTIDAGSTA